MLACQEQGVLGQKVSARASHNPPPPLVDDLGPGGSDPAGVFEAVVQHLAHAAGKQIPCEQTPRNIFYARASARDLSGARMSFTSCAILAPSWLRRRCAGSGAAWHGRPGGAPLRSVSCLGQLPPVHRGPFVVASHERGVGARGAPARHVDPVRRPACTSPRQLCACSARGSGSTTTRACSMSARSILRTRPPWAVRDAGLHASTPSTSGGRSLSDTEIAITERYCGPAHAPVSAMTAGLSQPAHGRTRSGIDSATLRISAVCCS